MNIHEFQAKYILRDYGVPISDFELVTSREELLGLVEGLGYSQAVLKIQVHAGGRGKAGGVKIARNKQQILEYGNQLLGMKIVNNQTGPQGIVAHQILISPLVEVTRELYMGIVIDRKRAQATLIASPEGGMDIEELAAKSPEKILTLPITPGGSLRSYNLLRLVHFMGWQGAMAEKGKKLALELAKAFLETDASLIEINPLVENAKGDLIALDAKFSLDDNAAFRQPKIAAYYDPSQMTPEEVKAKEYDLAYIALDGDIGCMVNGAGLAMATMDIIKIYGGKPANFLDVGGGATEDKVAAGFKIILGAPQVKAILVNIFGGIMNCETIAAGITAAAKELCLKVPLVVRLEGTNVEQGKQRLQQSGLPIIIAKTMAEAAEKVVSAARSAG